MLIMASQPRPYALWLLPLVLVHTIYNSSQVEVWQWMQIESYCQCPRQSIHGFGTDLLGDDQYVNIASWQDLARWYLHILLHILALN